MQSAMSLYLFGYLKRKWGSSNVLQKPNQSGLTLERNSIKQIWIWIGIAMMERGVESGMKRRMKREMTGLFFYVKSAINKWKVAFLILSQCLVSWVPLFSWNNVATAPNVITRTSFTELVIDPIRNASWLNWTELLLSFWTEFALLCRRHHTTSRTSKQSQTKYKKNVRYNVKLMLTMYESFDLIFTTFQSYRRNMGGDRFVPTPSPVGRRISCSSTYHERCKGSADQ